MKKIVLIPMLSMFCLMAQADIYSTNSGEINMVKVSQGSKKDKLLFQVCLKENLNSCSKTIGGKEFGLKQLERKRRDLIGRGVGVSALDLVGLVALVRGVAIVGEALGLVAGEIFLSTRGAVLAAGEWGKFVGIGAGLAGEYQLVTKKINPLPIFKKSKVISRDVLNDKNVYIDGSIDEYVKDLEDLLY
ncbi:MAG: hypothetical protein AB7I27_07980 [Bacteriovoracaceae bacterium]